MGVSSPGEGLFRLRRQAAQEALKDGPLGPYLASDSIARVGPRWMESPLGAESHQTVLAMHLLQDVVDYRCALQCWFDAVRPGGHLIVIVPHAFLYERQTALPSRWRPEQKRLYTPRKLIEEVEEALAPNSYRLACLADDDRGYDYDGSPNVEPKTGGDIVLALRKITPPVWALDETDLGQMSQADAPDYAFEPPATRIEAAERRHAHRILALKLDHLGDFLMGLSALERLRAAFPDAHLTLVVGSWNIDFAKGLQIADEILSFDAFPRNSTEEEPNVMATLGQFAAAVTGEYDLAIDLRIDTDTRKLLRVVRAPLRAGIGTKTQFPFLDIFLPIDFARNEAEAAREDRLDHHSFASQGGVQRSGHRLFSSAETVERHCAIIWGPYWRLRPGRYIFEPWLELSKASSAGLLQLDIGLNKKRVVERFITCDDVPRLAFEVETPETEFEFRIWTVEDAPSIDFSFFGGKLVRAGAASVLHQSEYAWLLVDLIEMRLSRTGLLEDFSSL